MYQSAAELKIGVGLEAFEREYYGPALVDAYRLESRHADYPRVLIGNGLLNYLTAMQRGPFASAQIHALAQSTAQDCRDLFLVDDDGLVAVDPFWPVENLLDPHHRDLATLASQAIQRVSDLARYYEVKANHKLAARYRRLSAPLAKSRHVRGIVDN